MFLPWFDLEDIRRGTSQRARQTPTEVETVTDNIAGQERKTRDKGQARQELSGGRGYI
jgi:hypothetical protein